MSKRDEDRYEIDPDDGLKREIVGEWSAEKHLRLRRYIDITRDTRKKYSSNRPAYVDLYCATGRARIRETPDVVDGSAVVAATMLDPPAGFTDLYFGDLELEHLNACQARLQAANVPQNLYPLHGPAAETAKQVVKQINPYGLHLAFLDPYSIGALPFSVIETLGSVKRMDLIIHISENDLQRNVIGKREFKRLDPFCPGWEGHVDRSAPNHVIKRQILEAWKANLASLGYKVSDNIERVRGDRNQPLYWLVLAARNDLANRFWSAVSNVSPQRGFHF